MQPNYFDRPKESPPGFGNFAARCLPVPRPAALPPPELRPLLPSVQRESPFADYVLSTHLMPWARGRAHRSATERKLRPPYPPPVTEVEGNGKESKESKKRRAREIDNMVQKMWELRRDVLKEQSWLPRSPEDEPESLLWVCANRFVRKEPIPGGVVLFFVHGNGFPKETWEPTIGMLLEKYRDIDEIYVWEAYNHGDAALINAENLGDTFDWADAARDVLQFLTFHRPLADRRSAPLHLAPHPREHIPRPVIAVGHSHGGEVIARAALYDPTLFSALIMVDAIVIMETLVVPTRREIQKLRDKILIQRTISRRAVWPSREEAAKFFAQTPFFQSHHPAVLFQYISHRLAPIPNSDSTQESADSKAVMLKESPFDEATFYTEPRAPAETWFLLPLLDPAVELRWIMGNDMANFHGGEEYARHTVWRRPMNTSNTFVREAGHFIPQQAPERLAREIADVLIRRRIASVAQRPGVVQLHARL